ncbi:MAG: glycosyltransferase family 4 protein [Gemmatimonadetes bacterium]|nr:glycosyltransferase family 4 protein [Gemmatimonadota bacterium]
MRIAYTITRSDDLGGAQIHVRDLAAALKESGHDVVVLAGGGGVLARQLEERGVEVVELRHMARPIRPFVDFRALRELVGHLRRLRPDIISTHSSKAGILGRIAGRRLGIPTITTAHGWLFDGPPIGRRQKMVWRIERSMAPLARRIVTVCESDRQLAIDSGVSDADRLVTIHNAMPDVDGSLRANPAVDPPRLLMVARFAPQKDHATLFRALATLLELDWELDLVGSGPQEDATRALAESLGLSGHIRFLGMREDVPELIAASQAYLLISHWEGFPRSILEALRGGLPVVATDVGGVREAVIDGETGFVVPENDDVLLADRLKLLIEHAELRTTMGRAARSHYEAQFTFERLVGEALALYESVLR